jgi:DNA polymerase delta subunit 1
MKKRDMLNTPMAGERISYVMIKGSKGQKAYEKSEDPLWVMEHNLPVDFEHYVNHQLKAPLTRIFEPVFG